MDVDDPDRIGCQARLVAFQQIVMIRFTSNVDWTQSLDSLCCNCHVHSYASPGSLEVRTWRGERA